MVVAVAFGIHEPAAVPERRSPPAPILMSPIVVEDEPTAFHLGIAISFAAKAGHLRGIERQVHMFGRIAMQIIDSQGTDTVGEKAAGESVGTAE